MEEPVALRPLGPTKDGQVDARAQVIDEVGRGADTAGDAVDDGDRTHGRRRRDGKRLRVAQRRGRRRRTVERVVDLAARLDRLQLDLKTIAQLEDRAAGRRHHHVAEHGRRGIGGGFRAEIGDVLVEVPQRARVVVG